MARPNRKRAEPKRPAPPRDAPERAPKGEVKMFGGVHSPRKLKPQAEPRVEDGD